MSVVHYEVEVLRRDENGNERWSVLSDYDKRPICYAEMVGAKIDAAYVALDFNVLAQPKRQVRIVEVDGDTRRVVETSPPVL